MSKEEQQQDETTDNLIIKATSDLFIATLLSAPKNEPILRNIINAVLTNSGHAPIKNAEVLNPYNVKEFAVDKQIVLDVRVKDELDRTFNIEIQTTPHAAFVERIMFGWAAFSSQLHAGNQYKKLNPVFCIVITEFKIFDQVDGVHLVFELRERNRPEVVLSNHLQMHFLRLYELLQGHLEVLEGVSPELRHWLNFLAYGGLKGEQEMSQIVGNDPLVMEAVAELQRFSSDPEMQELERRRKLWKLEYYSGLEAAKEEGEAKGEAKGESKAIVAFLKARFGKIQKSTGDAIHAITDPKTLEKLTKLAAKCESLDDFNKALK